MKYVVYSLIGLTATLLLIIVIAVIAIVIAKTSTKGVTDKIREALGDGKWARENWFSVTFFVLTLHLLVIAIDKHWWWENIAKQWWMGLITGLAIAWGTIAPEGAKKIHGKLAQFSIVLIILTFFIALGKQNIIAWWDKAEQKYSRPPNATAMSANGAGGPNSHVAQAVYDFMYAKLPSDEAFKMTRFAFHESTFRQFEDDGVTPIRARNPQTGEIIPNVVCAFQIDKTQWAKEIAETGFNVDTLDGCLNMALWIHKNRGDQFWTTKNKVDPELEDAKKQRIRLVAPAGEISPPFDVSWRLCDFDGEPSGDIFVYDDRGNQYKQGHGDKVPPTPTNSWSYMSQSDEDVTFYVACVKK